MTEAEKEILYSFRMGKPNTHPQDRGTDKAPIN